MYKQKEGGSDYVGLLDQNKTIAVPTDSIYFFLNQNSHILSKQYTNGDFYIKFISNSSRIVEENNFLPVSARVWIDLLTPGPLIIEIVSNKHSISKKYYFSGDDRLNSLFQKHSCDIFGVPILIAKNIYCSDNSVVKNAYSSVYVLESNPISTGFLPSVLRITDDNIFLFESIGTHIPNSLRSLSNSEIQIADKPMPFINNLLGGQNHPRSVTVNFVNDISEVNKPKAVILATKEKIQQSYDLHLDFFKQITNDGCVLINIGSQTNIPNIIKNLFENIYKAMKIDLPIFFLNQNWGSFQETMQEVLETISTKEVKLPNSFVLA